MCHPHDLREQPLVILQTSSLSSGTSSGTKSMINHIRVVLTLRPVGWVFRKACTWGAVLSSKKLKKERKGRKEIKVRSYFLSSLKTGQGHGNMMEMSFHGPVQSQVWIPPPQKTAILALVDLPTGIRWSRALMLPICASTLPALSTRERSGVEAAVNSDSASIKAKKMFVCLDLPQLLPLCSREWVQRPKSICEFKPILLDKRISELN